MLTHASPGYAVLATATLGASIPALMPCFLRTHVSRNAPCCNPCQDETKIAPALERVASNVGMEVSVGSYPVDR